MPRISIFTPSYNKREYVGSAIESVLRQTYGDFEYWILENSNDGETRNYIKENYSETKNIKYVEIDFTDEERKAKYPTAVLLNKYYPKANGEFIFYLSDDDIIYDDCFEVLMKYFDEHPTHDIAYFSQESHRIENGKWVTSNEIKATMERGKGTGQDLNCCIDGGQIMHRTSCLDSLKQPFFDFRWDGYASSCDGHFMEALGKYSTFYPIDRFLGTHRVTPKSTFAKP